jgi:antiviral helicase SLH1
MSPTALDSAEAQWQTQLAAMRAALADLKLPAKSVNGETSTYESEFNFDEDDEFTSGNSGDDVWDFISESEEELYSSDPNEDLIPDVSVDANAGGYGPQWLVSKCIGFAEKKQGLSGEDLQEQIMALLASDSVDEELQSTLTDIIGFDDLDFVIELISHRKEITAAAASPFPANKDEGIFGKLQTKRQREEALRRRDYEHKHATLGPSIDRDGPQYPHVYKAHSAGNTLDSRGRKYALPMGSERKEHDKYEEYSIPAGRVGTLGKGRKLVEISEMDGLCRKTFKGYKSLNRMQSLVYPVAYQTRENMLICAPTGAVSQPNVLMCFLVLTITG